MVTVADLVRELLDMPQDAPIALDGDCSSANGLCVRMEGDTVCVMGYGDPGKGRIGPWNPMLPR
jgi:hypothetical protein